MHRTRRVRAAVGMAALAVAAGACSGGSSSTRNSTSLSTRDPVRLVASSADAASNAKSARMSLSMSFASGARSGSFTADGAFDFPARAGTMTIDMSSLGLPGASGRIEMRMVDGVAYMDMSSLAGAAGSDLAQVLGGKHWFKLDISGLAGPSSGSGLGNLGMSDPSSMLDALRGVSNDVKQVGTDTARGVETTHYAMTLDMAKALERTPGQFRAQAGSALKTLGTGSIPADLWIDAQGRPRKLVVQLDSVRAPDVSAVAMTMELYDYGTAVAVQAPPVDDTVDMSGMVGGLLNGAGSGANAGTA